MRISEDTKAAKVIRDIYQERNERIMKRINIAASLKRENYWRAIIDIYCDEVNGFSEVGEVCANSAKEQRGSATAFKKAGQSDGDMQLGLLMPSAWLNVLETADPELRQALSDSDTDGDRRMQKKMNRLLMKTFPEFVVRQDLM